MEAITLYARDAGTHWHVVGCQRVVTGEDRYVYRPVTAEQVNERRLLPCPECATYAAWQAAFGMEGA